MPLTPERKTPSTSQVWPHHPLLAYHFLLFHHFLRAHRLLQGLTRIAVSHDPIYDDPSRPLTDVACSDGENGLITRYGAYGWETQGNMPRYIGGIDTIGWNSTLCGTCWILQYEDTTVAIYAIDQPLRGSASSYEL